MWFALLVAAAFGADVEGFGVAPASGDARDPLTATSPWLLPAGQGSAGLTLDAAYRPLVAGPTPTDWSLVAVDGLVGAQLSAGYALSRRVAFGLTARSRLVTVGADDPTVPSVDPVTTGPSLSDLRLWVPISVVGGDLGISVTPHLDLPLGDVAALGGEAFGGGLRAAVGLRRGAWQGSVELGGGLHPRPDDAVLPADFGWSARLGGGWSPGTLGLVGELEARHATDGAPPAAEARLAGRLGSGRWQGTAGVGVPLTAAPTVPLARGLAELRWVPEREGAVGGRVGDLVIAVTDAGGLPLTPVVDVDGAVEEVRSTRGGVWTVDVAPGEHEVGVAAAGYGRQARRIRVDGDAPVRLEAALLPVAGDGVARIDVRDPGDRPVADAIVVVGGVTLGSVGVDGVLTVGGLDPTGRIQVEASAPGLVPMAGPVERSVGDASPLYLDRPPGQVLVRVLAGGSPVTDAAIRVLGPETLRVPSLDAAGEALLVVPPGDWVVVVSSPAHGLQQRNLRMEEGDRTLTEVVVDLRPPVGEARLRVELRDPDGRPVSEARLWLDEVPIAASSTGGVLVVEGLAAVAGSLRAEAPSMWPTEPVAVDLSSGLAEALIPMRWKPGTVRVVARSADGPVADAQVRFVGPVERAALPLGPDGRLETTLEPGSWTAVVAAPKLGVQARELVVEADRTSLIVVEAVLAGEAGSAALTLRVVDPLGAPVEGARVRVDGADVGTTAAGGHLRLEGLAGKPVSLRVESPLHEPWERAKVAPGEVAARLEWRRGLVEVVARAGEQPVDAMIRMVGPAPLPPLALGPTGSRRVAVPPGPWTVVGAAERHGVQSADVVIQPATTSERVQLAFAAGGSPTAIASLPARPVTVRTLRRATGERVGAAVRVYGEEAMAQQDTASAGELVVPLRPGAWTAIASAPALGLAQSDFVVPVAGEVVAVELSLGPATIEERDGVMRFVEEVRFETGQATLLDDSREMLDDVVRTLRIRPSLRLVEVQGHTDDVGSAEGNRVLSERRAQAVRDYLVANGISASRLVARGYGLERPKAGNDTPEGRAANRRVELHILEVVDGGG